MPIPFLAAAMPSLIQAGFSGAQLLKGPRKYEEEYRGRSTMLGRRAGEGMWSPRQEQALFRRLRGGLMQTAGEETESLRKAIFPILEQSKLAGARLLSDPYRRARGRMVEFEEGMEISERGAAQEAGEQFMTEKEGFQAQERQRRGALTGELVGGLAGVGTAGMQRYLLGDLLKDKKWGPYIKMAMGGVQPPSGYGYSKLMGAKEEIPFSEINTFYEDQF